MGGGAGGFFKGTKGSNNISSVMENKNISLEKLKENPKVFSNKSAKDIALELENVGYKVEIKASTCSRSGAQIIKIKNPGEGKNISQIQVSPGGGRHGENAYVKISTTDNGIIKIVDGSKDTYKTDGTEKAIIIFIKED